MIADRTAAGYERLKQLFNAIHCDRNVSTCE